VLLVLRIRFIFAITILLRCNLGFSKHFFMSKTINIQGNSITVISKEAEDFISLTDMARSQMQEAIIFKWLSLKSTIEYLGEWESLYNPNFNYTEFGAIKC
jgi:KilA-N domain